MGSYGLRFKNSVAKDLAPIPKRDVTRIRALAADPYPPTCEKLAGGGRYRVRQRVYRIVYGVRDDELVVIVIKVGHRREVQRRA